MSGREEVIAGDGYTGADTHDGIISRAVQHLFAAMAKKTDTKYALSASYLEIYNEGIYDLLNLKVGLQGNMPGSWKRGCGGRGERGSCASAQRRARTLCGLYGYSTGPGGGQQGRNERRARRCTGFVLVCSMESRCHCELPLVLHRGAEVLSWPLVRNIS